jgi:hypothetical protein
MNWRSMDWALHRCQGRDHRQHSTMQETDTDGASNPRRRVIILGNNEAFHTSILLFVEHIVGRVFELLTLDQHQYHRLLGERGSSVSETAFTRVHRFTSSGLFHAHPPPIVVVFQDARDSPWVHQLLRSALLPLLTLLLQSGDANS